MSHCRQQGFIDAPVERVWELISDVEHHPEWWPRVLEVDADVVEEGATYRQLTETPRGEDEMQLLIESREELRNLRIRCLTTGTFVRFEMTEARGGTFVGTEMGMDPHGLWARVVDAVAGRRYFSTWMRSTMEALDRAATDQEEQAGPQRA